MPGLIAFKRRWSTGSDDFVVPGFMLFLLHVILFIAIAIILGTSEDLDYWGSLDVDSLTSGSTINITVVNKATCAHQIRNFSFGYLCLIALAAVIEIVLVGFSMQGTILDPAPRKPVEYMIYFRMAFGVIEMIFSIISAARMTQNWKQCDVLRDVYNMHIGIVVVNFIVFFIVVLVGYCVFDPTGGKYYKIKNAYEQPSMSSSRIERMRSEFESETQQTWLTRLSNCFCCVSNNSTNIKQVALDEVSTLLSKFFKDYDLVMSDIIAGLTLLRHKQQCIENETTISGENNVQEFMCGRPVTAETNFVDLRNQATRKEYENMLYYCAYSIAAYGPLFYWVENSATGLCGVLHECLCGENPTCTSRCCTGNQIQRRRTAVIRGRAGCGWALAGIQKSLREHGLQADVVYVSLKNDVYKQPFFVCVDHDKKSVVVTVRGTLGEADALTDLVASPEIIPSEDNDGTWKAHKGMVQGAQYIKKLLLHEDMVLSLGFGHDLSKNTRDYDLVLIGHSLGAGVASILALLLRPLYPNLKCYAFSPPGGLMSHSAMEASKQIVQTLVFGKDVVPRTGIPQLENLRDDVIELLKHTDLPKYRIILGNICGSLEHRHGLLRAERLSSRALRLASRRVNSVTNETTTTELVSPMSEELYPPGAMYHLVYSSQPKPGCSSNDKKVKKKYYLVHADNVSDFREIIVSHQMISHHLPQEVMKAMKKALDASHNDRISRTYAESATLPFVENSTQKEQKRELQQLNKSSNTPSPIENQPRSDARVRIEYPVQDEDEDSDDSMEPFLNTNQNNIVEAVADIDAALTSSSSSSSSIDIKAPLARPDSFTLSIPAHSPIAVVPKSTIVEVEVEQDSDVENEAEVSNDDQGHSNHTQANNSLHLPEPQASSTPFLPDKNVPENIEQSANSSFLDESNQNHDENIESSGKNAVS